MEFTREQLEELRNEISLGSIYTNDFKNSFDIPANICQNFFDGYIDYLAEIMIDDNIDDDSYFDYLDEYDTIDNLWNWYNCFDEDPFCVGVE